MRAISLLIGLLVWLTAATNSFSATPNPARPNVLWFVVDDMSAHFSCYGETQIATPHVDRLAKEGVRFTHAHVTAPVCSTCRSAMITGMHQTTLGVHHHRMTSPPTLLPKEVVPLPILFRQAGYYTCNGDGLRQSSGKVRKKTDYNFRFDTLLYDGVDWSGRRSDQPFFMQVQLAGGKLRGADVARFDATLQTSAKLFGDSLQEADVLLPPYYPQDPVLQKDWSAYLETVRQTDHHVGQILQRLEDEGILDQTLIVFMTDHGISHARGKQFLYREGTHVPFIVRAPASVTLPQPPGTVRDDLIEHIDMAATSLAVAGIPIPDGMQSQDVFAQGYQRRNVAFAARDRCDETIDCIRSVRSKNFLYIRNYQPFRPLLQPNRYKDNKVLLQRLRELRNAGELTDTQMELLFQERRAGEELYDLSVDPYETRNLAKDSQYGAIRAELRALLDNHLLQTRDAGFLPEPTIARISQRNQSIRDYCRSDKNYPLQEILNLANQAITRDPQNVAEFRKQLRHKNPTMRYWATMGLRILENASVVALHDLRTMLDDPDSSVRITAAYTLSRFGDDGMHAFLLNEAQKSKSDAQALWALDAVKFLDAPDALRGRSRQDLVKGPYSGRAYDFLQRGGLVFGNGTDYWNTQ